MKAEILRRIGRFSFPPVGTGPGLSLGQAPQLPLLLSLWHHDLKGFLFRRNQEFH